MYSKIYMGRNIILQRGDKMKKFRRGFLSTILVASIFATSVFAAPNTSTLEEQKEKVESEVKSLQKELTELMTNLNLTERKLITTGEAIIEATKQLQEAEENEKEQYENMVKRIVLMYENGSDNMLALFLESGSLAEMFQSAENVQALHDYDRKELQKYIDTKEEITQLKATLEVEQAELEELQVDLEKQKQALSDKIEAKQDEVDDIQAQIEEAERKAAEEARRKAEEEERRRQEEEDDKKQQLVINNNKYTGTGDQSVGDAIVAAARTYIGVWYLWGGNDYNGIDCSGLTKAAHAAVGINIARWSGDQKVGGKKINSVAEALPGDIIGYEGHVAIYIGNERVIHAPRKGKQVQEATVYMKKITAIRRYW